VQRWLWRLRRMRGLTMNTTHRTATDLQRIIRERVDNDYSHGLVAGLLFPDGGVRIVAYGDSGLGRPLDPDDVFEIGSITKVFTGTLLAEMAQRGEVALDEPVKTLVPAGVTVPARNGRTITLEDLATHTSGLPRLPENLAPAGESDPYVDYTPQQLYDFLSSYTLTRDVGAEFEYSNEGAGLLGHLLALRAGQSYADIVRERILAPLGMTSTAVEVTAPMRERFVQGHDGDGRAVAHWNFTTLAGAGGLRSTAADMLAFAAAGLDDIGMHALDSRMELAKVHTPVVLPAAVLERYAGEYAGPDGSVTLAGADGGLTADSPGLPPLRLLAIDNTTFFIKPDSALVTFELDDGGRVTGAVLEGGGAQIRFTKTR